MKDYESYHFISRCFKYLNQMHRKCPTIYKGPLPKASQGWVANVCNPLTDLLAIDLVVGHRTDFKTCKPLKP